MSSFAYRPATLSAGEELQARCAAAAEASVHALLLDAAWLESTTSALESAQPCSFLKSRFVFQAKIIGFYVSWKHCRKIL